MTAKILRVGPVSYEVALNTFDAHFRGCDVCTEKALCEQGLALNYLAWALMCPQPQPLRQRVSVERRRSS